MLNITHYQRNANQNHNEVPSPLVRMAAIKKSTNKTKKSQQTINAGESVEKRESSYTVGGNAN